MIDLKPYPEYKDSGVPWLEKLPKDWEILRAKHVFRPIDVRSQKGLEELLSVSEKKGVTPRRLVNVTMFKAESYEGYKLCWSGDLVINSLWAWMQGLGFSNYHGIISSAYGVYRIKEGIGLEYKFFNYLIRSRAYLWELRVNSKGIWRSRYQLTDESFLGIPIIIPPETERIQIARFLDFKTDQISRFIKAKKRLIELLKEQKQVIINDAVTGKIDIATGKPYSEYKDSDVEWLGIVPKGWQVLRVKHLARVISKGTTPSTEGREILEHGVIRFFKAENIVEGTLTDKPLCFIDDATNSILKRSQLHENDVLFVIAGATIGKVAVVREPNLPANTNQAVAFIRPNKKVSPDYLAEWLQSPCIKQMIWLNAVQSAQPNLSMTDLGNLTIPLPNLEEQLSLLIGLQSITKNIENAITRTEREIALLHEYRDRLIADVVTGKIDIRAIDIPEDIEALNPDDLDMTDEEISDFDTMEIIK
jgi:type I restriction enzyme S subunit